MAAFSARLSKMLVLLSLIFSIASAKSHGGFRGVGLRTEAPTESPIQIAIEPDVTIAPVSMTDETADVGTITDVAVDDADLATLVSLLTLAGVADALAVDGPLTVFAPTNAAFTNALTSGIDISSFGIETIAEVLSYHVVVGSYMASDITDGLTLTTLQGETIEFGIDGGVVTVNGQVISTTDISASNGYIHKIDGVMLPEALRGEPEEIVPASEETSTDDVPVETAPDGISEETQPDVTSDVGTITDVAVGDDDLAFLVNLLALAGIADALAVDGPLTVFAPTNAAFTNLLTSGNDIFALGIDDIAGVLNYHVVEGSYMASDITDGLILETLLGETIEFGIDGGVVTVNGQVISTTDIPASNGFIHKIDGVMFPKAILVESDGTTPDDTSDVGTITDIAIGAEDLSILVELLILADLAGVLAGDGPLTVFAPTNAAFTEVLIDTEDFSALVIDEVSQLLTYHVVAGSYMASDITDGLILETLQGETIEFGIDGGVVTVNQEVISATDIPASNGFIHIIDGVMFPKAILVESDGTTPDESSTSTIVDIAFADPDLGVLYGLLIEAGLVDDLSAEGPFTVFAPTDIAFISTLDEEVQDPSIAGDTDPNEIADILEFVSDLDEVGAGGVASLYDPNLLAEVLNYHVVLGTYLASNITDGLTLPTVNGETILFNITDDGVTVNGKAVMVADISASNGVIHKIDGVLVPSME